MWKIILACTLIGCVTMVPANNRDKRYSGGFVGAYTGGYTGAGAGSYAGTGNFAASGTGDYAGTGFLNYAGTDNYKEPYYGYAPDFDVGFIDPYAFHQQLTAQIQAQHAAQNNALTSTYTSGDAFVSADASSYPDNIQFQQTFGPQYAIFDALRNQVQYNKDYKDNRYAPSFASASGSIGPGGIHQSAQIQPVNPAIPNINNRFSEISGPGGYKGVSVSSFSSSSDIDGKKTSHRGAITTVNDNGKIRSYMVDY